MNEAERWSNIEDVAYHLGVSKDTVRSWIRKGVIPYHRVGKQYRFRLSEIDSWVMSGRAADTE